MACQITIASPVGQESTPGQGITTLTVSGTATDCTAVRVRVHQTQPVDVFTPPTTATATTMTGTDGTLSAGTRIPSILTILFIMALMWPGQLVRKSTMEQV